MSRESYDEEIEFNSLSEYADFNLKYGPFFAYQSNCYKNKTATSNNAFKKKKLCTTVQSLSNSKFKNKNRVNKLNKTK